MENNLRHIKYSIIKSELKKIKHHFPCDVKFLHIIKSNDVISIFFINEDNQDVTQRVMNVVLNDENVTIYDILLGTIMSISIFVDKMEDNIIYIHSADFSSNTPHYFNYDVFSSLRHKLKDVTVKGLSYKLGIYFTVIYNIEKRLPIQYSFDTIFKYSLFFKVSIFKLMNKYYGEQMIGVFLIDLMARGVISKQTADAILADYQKN